MIVKVKMSVGFRVDGADFKTCDLRHATVRDSYEVAQDPETAENDIYKMAAMYARRISLPDGQRVSTSQILDLADFDLGKIVEADKELNAALAAGFSGDKDPAPENPEAA